MLSLEEKIFNLPNSGTFEEVALEVFDFQYHNNGVYRNYVDLVGKKKILSLSDIPFLPIEFFKNKKIVSGNNETELLFKSSGTTGMSRSEHYVSKASLYERSFSTIYQRFIGNPEEQVILALLPNYLEQGNSSLVYMVDNLIKRSSELSGFILDKKDEIKERYDNAIKEKKKVVVFGVSYSLLDLAEAGIDLSEALIIETGGMKGRRKEMSKEEIHKIICQGTGVRYVSSEYGMTELLSQAYSDKEGKFTTPEWMKVFIRDINDPFAYVENGKSGGINVIDLANLYSCSFIATQDLGKIEGDQFSILGRFDNADIRGCNLMVE
jgi:phenylacetate-coenzyme A ligase PaaK-like adenylate-forming protein